MEISFLSNCPTESIIIELIITDPLIFWLLIKQGGPKNNVKFVGFNVDASELHIFINLHSDSIYN